MASRSIGIFFGTSTGSTEEAAHLISAEFGDAASEPIEIDEVQGSLAAEFAKFDSLVVGTPTWNTGADTERSGTTWDEIYYSEMKDLSIAGKKVAVFGLGDSVSYAENYADATGELHDVFENLGCKMIGYTSQEGYQHVDSKSIRGDLFCGLLLDAENEEEMKDLSIAGKKVAVFGLGDSVSYAENYADATGELHDVFENLGCKMIGYTSQEGYQHVDSKSIRGDLFCGLLLDAENEEEMTEDRVRNWIPKLINEGILESSSEAAPAAVAAPVASGPQVEKAAEVVFDDQVLAEEIIAEVKKTRTGYAAHYNPRTDETMWISTDGKKSYVTAGAPGYE
eukprot:243800_1